MPGARPASMADVVVLEAAAAEYAAALRWYAE